MQADRDCVAWGGGGRVIQMRAPPITQILQGASGNLLRNIACSHRKGCSPPNARYLRNGGRFAGMRRYPDRVLGQRAGSTGCDCGLRGDEFNFLFWGTGQVADGCHSGEIDALSEVDVVTVRRVDDTPTQADLNRDNSFFVNAQLSNVFCCLLFFSSS